MITVYLISWLILSVGLLHDWVTYTLDHYGSALDFLRELGLRRFAIFVALAPLYAFSLVVWWVNGFVERYLDTFLAWILTHE
jgi:hypothetical protein